MMGRFQLSGDAIAEMRDQLKVDMMGRFQFSGDAIVEMRDQLNVLQVTDVE